MILYIYILYDIISWFIKCNGKLKNINIIYMEHFGVSDYHILYIYVVAVLLHIESRCRLDLRNNSLHHFIVHRNLKLDFIKYCCIYIIYLTQNKMNLFVLSGHGSESFAAFLNGVILQKTTQQLSLQLSSRDKS